MPKLFLFLARFTTTFWIGAAIMFVLLTVVEILSGQFDTIVLDTLVLTRFPIYYLFSWVLLSISLLSGAVCWRFSGRKRHKLFTILIACSLLLLLVDYFWVYLRLEAMLTPLGSPRPQPFPFYHKLTEVLNTIAMLINFFAAVVINWSIKGLIKNPQKNLSQNK